MIWKRAIYNIYFSILITENCELITFSTTVLKNDFKFCSSPLSNPCCGLCGSLCF